MLKIFLSKLLFVIKKIGNMNSLLSLPIEFAEWKFQYISEKFRL